MSLSVPPDVFLLPFEELDDEDNDPETLVPSDPADPLPDGGVDNFFVDMRSYTSGSNQFSRARPVGQEGLRIVDSDSETDTDEQMIAIGDNPFGNEIDTSFRWECLPVMESRSDSIEDFEWEDLAERVDEREILSLAAFPGVDEENPISTEDEEELDFERINVEWEFLLAVNNMVTRNGADSVHDDDQEGFDYPSDYEVFDQFVDHGGAEWMKCGRPAAKSVVESLPSILLTAEDVAQNNTHCAICTDEISLTVKVKKLPCLHHYHEHCIVPWLLMRNTCPLCRYELPSSDAIEEEAQARYDFVVLQDS
ncbi:hypothetical protein KFK09_013908 [Dendrobium nobile]|uniref:RING-type domain-containing protein n=1 Tax=Dendrobium nobile TaxID=94219 RepID=A0A8T3B8G7_DENNO|nr:hypothetical protein KFK09_013908 [Dendrobium nobile]